MQKELESFVDLTLKRFLEYAQFWTTSDRNAEDTPSTKGQWELVKTLLAELKNLGIKNLSLDDHCYLVAEIPASKGKENAPSVGFLAHLDTSAEISGKDVKPVLIDSYDGKTVILKGGLSLDPGIEEGLAKQKGKAIVHSGGETLLGADDKAGIAIIMGAVEYLLKHPETGHGPVEVIFTPDEETGKGLPFFPLEKLKSKNCFTVDGGPKGELEYECFNAYSAMIEFSGKSMHLGTARGILVNASLMAAVYAAMLPRSESPEATDGYYGYYCPLEIHGDIENAKLEVFIRDYDKKGAERRLDALKIFARAAEAQFPGGKVKVSPVLQYLNMKEKISKTPHLLQKLRQAFKNSEIEIKEKPIRGGTDGSRLTEMGIPTPNIFTGGRNFHSRMEWLSVEEMAAACSLVVELIRLWADE